MATPEDRPNPAELASDLAGGPLEGVDFSNIFSYTHEDVEYLLSRRPFFQILNVDATFESFEKVKIIKATTGWNIHDLDDAISASPGEYLFGGSEDPFAETAEELQGKIVNPGKGTVINQAFLTSVEAIQMIKDRWPGVHIVDGDETSKWSLWVASQELGLPIIGYEPADLELAEKKRKMLRKRNKFIIDSIILQKTLKK